jgi:hypothetical protein
MPSYRKSQMHPKLAWIDLIEYNTILWAWCRFEDIELWCTSAVFKGGHKRPPIYLHQLISEILGENMEIEQERSQST